MSYKITDTIIVDNNKNISSIGTALFSGPVIIGGGTSTGTVSQPLQVTGTNGAYIGGNLGIGSANPTSKLWVSGDIYGAGIVTAYVLNASKDPGSGIATDFTNSLFGNGWRVSAPGSTTYYKLATLPAGGGGSTFDHLVINGVLGAWTNGNQTPFEITFSNRGAFNYKYISYGSVRSDVRIIGISTNSNVEIWAQHQVSQFTKLVYNIANSIQAIVVSNPTSTTTAPTGTTVFDSSTVTPRFIINESDNVGIGTTNPTSKLQIVGDVRVSGVVTATTFIGALTGTATSLSGGLAGNIVYQSAANATAFLVNGGSGTVLQSNGVGNAPTWVTAAPSGAVSGITVRDSNSNLVGTSGSITQLTFSTGLSVTGTSGAAGIATITLSSNIVGSALSISGISTFTNGPVLVGTATSTGTASQRLQVDGGAYVSDSVGIGTTNPEKPLHLLTSIATPLIIQRTATNNSAAEYRNSTSSMWAGLAGNANGWGVGASANLGTDAQILVTRTGGELLVGRLSATGTSSQKLQVESGAYVSARLGVGVTNPATNTQVAIAGTLGISEVGGAGTRTLLFSSTSGFTLNHNDNSQITFQTLGVNRLTYSHSSNFWTIPAGVPLLVGTASSTGTAGQVLQVAGGAYVSGNFGVGNTNPGATLNVVPTASSIAGLFSGTTSSDMVRITQLGSGNALVVEDSTNPDSSPFVVTGIGSVGIGTASPAFTADIAGDARVTSTNKMRFGGTAGTTNFYIQYNSTANSLDFVAG
jgi:hypothetical protein